MLASSQNRHNHLHQQPPPFATSFTPSQPLSFQQISQQLAAQDPYSQKLLNSYLESQQQAYRTQAATDNNLAPHPTQWMTNAYDFANPAIRIQQSTPTPQYPSSFAHSFMPPANNPAASGLDNWAFSQSNGQSDGQTLQTPKNTRTHQRAASSSSIGSNGSQYQGGSAANYTADEASSAFSNHLPTPSQTPTQDSFMNNNNNHYNSFSTNSPGQIMAAHQSMKQALMEQNGAEEEVPGFAHSARQSVSSSYGHDSPATPHTAHEDFDERFKMPPSGETPLRKVDSWLFDEFLAYDDDAEMRPHTTMSKMERAYPVTSMEGVYDNASMVAPSQPMVQAATAQTGSLLSPFRHQNAQTIMQRTLQAAQNARSQSPSSNVSRAVSPFRQNSPYAGSPHFRVGTVAEQREQTLEADAAHAMKANVAEEPKTISPKDALLDYHEADEDSKMPLFPESGPSDYGNYGGDYRNATQSTFDTTATTTATTTTEPTYQRNATTNWATPQFSNNFPASAAASTSAPFTFATPAPLPGGLNGLPWSATSQYRPIPTSMPSATDATPEFPAHLTTMESSASEAEPQGSQASSEQLKKPASSAADTGTYTCTYHGCTLRFETPQKLQKHKREGHRNTAPTSAPIGSGMSSAALLERNSQAGPHKCERTNPTTGKPCNTIFSRPYDLTRHEDTIHNSRKQKVRCALCVEEKTFSRNDALTRHMRVVHPEVDFPGKHRRRGATHD